ncbi:MAG: LLM class flavin-dependent oxidoreductase [Porticoccaceae bacterium]
MEIGIFSMPTIGPRAEIEKGMAGVRTDLYQSMLKNLVEQARYLDETGYYGFGFTEHHFHIEGEEVSTNPIMLDLYLGLHTKRLRVGQLGNVLPSHHPIRVAEDIAILDQMTQGRAFAGFARGYQSRWVNVLGQRFEALRRNDGDHALLYEDTKRELYEEHFDIIMKAWSNDTFSHQGKHWQIPPAEIYWPAHEVSAEFGQGVDANGIIREIGIAPKTYNKRIPDLFQPFSFSEKTIRWAMRHNVSPISIIAGDMEAAKGQFRAAQEELEKTTGKSQRFGARMGITREIVCADTDAEAKALALDAGTFLWCKFFQPFGFNAAITLPGEDPMTVKNDFDSLVERGLVIYGSPDTVKRKLEALFKALPVDYFWMMNYNELLPQKPMMRHMELMTKQVWPHFTDKIKA